MREVSYTTRAKADFVSAFVWYEREQAGLGEAFRLSIEATASLISRRPEGFKIVDGRFRRAAVRRFPYAVFFEFDDSRIVVHAVFHTSLNPNRLQQRIAGDKN